MLSVNAIDRVSLGVLLDRYGLEIAFVAWGEQIPGSYWGESEAGLIGSLLYLRPDTPLHSALHEGAHYVCMTPERRVGLNRDAGGDDAEESAVCYLQLLLADALAGTGRERLFVDMDTWGYSFRLGSSKAWFEQDARDAQRWLLERGIIDMQSNLTGALRVWV